MGNYRYVPKWKLRKQRLKKEDEEKEAALKKEKEECEARGDVWKEPKKIKRHIPNTSKERKFVEIGRVVMLKNGKHRGTAAMIVDIVDHNWVILEGRCFEQKGKGIPLRRRVVNLKDLELTQLRTKVPYLANRWYLRERIKLAGIDKLLPKTGIYRKWEKRRFKRHSTDLERWRVAHNRRARTMLIKIKYNKLKKKVCLMALMKNKKKNPIPYAERVFPAGNPHPIKPEDNTYVHHPKKAVFPKKTAAERKAERAAEKEKRKTTKGSKEKRKKGRESTYTRGHRSTLTRKESRSIAKAKIDFTAVHEGRNIKRSLQVGRHYK